MESQKTFGNITPLEMELLSRQYGDSHDFVYTSLEIHQQWRFYNLYGTPCHGYITLLVQLVLLISSLNLRSQDLCLLPLALWFVSTEKRHFNCSRPITAPQPPLHPVPPVLLMDYQY